MDLNLTYERTPSESYLKIIAEGILELDANMLLHKSISGLLPMERCFVNETEEYWYPIGGKQDLDTYCEIYPIRMDFLEKLIFGICALLERLDKNLLSAECLYLSPKLIFVEHATGELFFTAYPAKGISLLKKVQELMEYLLTKIDHKDKVAVEAGYALYERTLMEEYHILELRDIVLQIRRKNEVDIENETAPIEQKEEIVTAPLCTKEGDPIDTTPCGFLEIFKELTAQITDNPLQLILNKFWMKDREKKHRTTKNRGKKNRGTKDGGTQKRGIVREKPDCYNPQIFYPDAEEEAKEIHPTMHPTICLSDYRPIPDGILLYEGYESLSNIYLQKETRTIGQGRDADIVINKETISHFHARVTYLEEQYYIEDLNSKNGTFINEEALPYKEMRKLNSNDIVRFADVKYRFV